MKKVLTPVLLALAVPLLIAAGSPAWAQEESQEARPDGEEEQAEDMALEDEAEEETDGNDANNNAQNTQSSEDFIPSVQISEDLSVAFPVDI